MKRNMYCSLTAAALTLVLAISLTACGSTQNASGNTASGTTAAAAQSKADSENSAPATESSNENSSAEAKGYSIGFCNYAVSNSWQVQMEAEFKYRAEELVKEGVLSEYYVTNADGDVSKQIADFKDLMTKGVDAIVITAASSSALSPVCEEAMDAGIVVISFDSLVDTDKVTGKVSCDDQEFGRIGAKFIVDQIGEKGDVVMLNGIAGSTCSENRYLGAKEIFDQYPDIKIVNETDADWDYAKAKVAVEALIGSNQHIDAIWSQGGAMTQAAVDAYNEAGWDLVPMSGEGSNGFLKVWKENIEKGFTSICPWYPTYISTVAMDQALRALNGETVEAMYILPSDSITEDDIDTYYTPDLPESYWVITNLNDEQINEIFK